MPKTSMLLARTLEILNCLKKSQNKKSLFLGMSLHRNKSKFQNARCLNWQKRTSLSLNLICTLYMVEDTYRKKTWLVIKQIKWQYSTFSKYLYMTVEVYNSYQHRYLCFMYACDYDCIHLIWGQSVIIAHLENCTKIISFLIVCNVIMTNFCKYRKWVSEKKSEI